jgi:hypothetical protein
MMVRSKTPPGQPPVVIHTRRPFDDPGVQRVYYRLEPVITTIVAKQHLPYLMDAARMQRWQQLFLEKDYEVTVLPSYKPEVSANPFDAFRELPIKTRYEFMLDEAEFTIMGFIKGPVCRGQIALNVINDHFWVVFTDPDDQQVTADFLAQEVKNLRMPAEKESNALPITTWITYSNLEKKYREARLALLNELYPSNDDITLDLIWDGDGNNRNAALTIFRHVDSATVTKGLIGKKPKTAWVISYPLLERIHYLLVAGYDVYGNVGHQLNTRLYMDFLRMEGESNFIHFMPEAYGEDLFYSWYQGSESTVQGYVSAMKLRGDDPVGIPYPPNSDPMTQFFIMLADKMGPDIIRPDLINRGVQVKDPLIASLQRLADIQGKKLDQLPAVAMLRVNKSNGEQSLYSLIKNLSHSNVSSIFNEQSRLIPEEQTLSVVAGVIGSYPNTFFDVNEQQLSAFVDAVQELNSDAAYAQLLSEYGVRRTDPQFWDYSDWLTATYYDIAPLEAGLLDYNRIENR